MLVAISERKAQVAQGEHHLRQRLLRDLAELSAEPYPHIRLHVDADDGDLSRACLVLSPDGYDVPLHLTVAFGPRYPLDPPAVSIQTPIQHPNVFGSWICATILRPGEGYTPAYTLKGVAIQMLSFFSSDGVEQDYGGVVRLSEFKRTSAGAASTFQCARCRHGFPDAPEEEARVAAAGRPGESNRARKRRLAAERAEHAAAAEPPPAPINPAAFFLARLPDEILLQVLAGLDFAGLTALAQAWPRVSAAMAAYDVVRRRELQCFALKRGYGETALGVGVAARRRGRQGDIASEFELLSREAFCDLRVRASVHGIAFAHWLPLPISRRHYRLVRGDLHAALREIHAAASLDGNDEQVLFAFMNHIVVRLNADLEGMGRQGYGDDAAAVHGRKSTLRHASERAIESYFHLFHILLCLAVEDDRVVRNANRLILSFVDGATGKDRVPNLGYLLIALLISDVEITEPLMKAIITETVTRNVVWLLDGKGAGMAELSHMEADDQVSEYRLQRTFEGSRTSYRLLMFTELFRRTARPPAHADAGGDGAPRKKSLAELRDELFDRHGGPPRGAAARLAAEVRRLQTINDFPSFLREMGVTIPGRLCFSQMLRRTVRESMTRGYSGWGLSEAQAMTLRRAKEGGFRDHDAENIDGMVVRGIATFFPQPQRGLRAHHRGGRAQSGGRGGR